jgi:hypothetical protein
MGRPHCTRFINNASHDGPFVHVLAARLREVSLVSVAGDESTQVSIAAQRKQESIMSTETTTSSSDEITQLRSSASAEVRRIAEIRRLPAHTMRCEIGRGLNNFFDAPPRFGGRGHMGPPPGSRRAGVFVCLQSPAGFRTLAGLSRGKRYGRSRSCGLSQCLLPREMYHDIPIRTR